MLSRERIASGEILLREKCDAYSLIVKVGSLSTTALQGAKHTLALSEMRRAEKRQKPPEADALRVYPQTDEVNEVLRIIKKYRYRPPYCVVPAWPEGKWLNAETVRIALAMRGRYAVIQVRSFWRTYRSANLEGWWVSPASRGSSQQRSSQEMNAS